MSRYGARHELGIDLVGQQLEAGHVGARPADARQRARGHGRPEAVGEQAEHQVARDRAGDAEQIDPLAVDPVGERDQQRHRHHVGAEEDRRDPARLAVRQAPALHHLRQQRGPEACADLHEDLRRADDRDQTRAGLHLSRLRHVFLVPDRMPTKPSVAATAANPRKIE